MTSSRSSGKSSQPAARSGPLFPRTSRSPRSPAQEGARGQWRSMVNAPRTVIPGEAFSATLWPCRGGSRRNIVRERSSQQQRPGHIVLDRIAAQSMPFSLLARSGRGAGGEGSSPRLATALPLAVFISMRIAEPNAIPAAWVLQGFHPGFPGKVLLAHAAVIVIDEKIQVEGIGGATQNHAIHRGVGRVIAPDTCREFRRCRQKARRPGDHRPAALSRSSAQCLPARCDSC